MIIANKQRIFQLEPLLVWFILVWLASTTLCIQQVVAKADLLRCATMLNLKAGLFLYILFQSRSMLSVFQYVPKYY